jgi:hypothetical protein
LSTPGRDLAWRLLCPFSMPNIFSPPNIVARFFALDHNEFKESRFRRRRGIVVAMTSSRFDVFKSATIARSLIFSSSSWKFEPNRYCIVLLLVYVHVRGGGVWWGNKLYFFPNDTRSARYPHQQDNINRSPQLFTFARVSHSPTGERRNIYIITPDHQFLDRSPNIGPLISCWELNKFKNCWNKSFRTSKVLTLLLSAIFELVDFPMRWVVQD